MWLSDRRAFLAGLAAVAALAGCGFRPVHAPGGASAGLIGAVRADDPGSASDYRFVAALEERLGRPQAPRFALEYRIDRQTVGGGFARVQLVGHVDYVLRDIATGRERARGRVDARAGYSSTATQFAESVAAEDAEIRLMRMLVDGLVTRLMLVPDLTSTRATG